MNVKKMTLLCGFLFISLIASISILVVGCSTSKTSATTNTAVSRSLASITAMPETPDNLIVGKTQAFTAMGNYSDGSTADITSQVTWTSSDTGKVTVSAAGMATGVAIGNTTITAAILGKTSQVVNLTVVPVPALSSISVTSSVPHNLGVGATLQFSAKGTYADGSTADISSQVAWVSSDTTIARISSSGLATGAAVGTTNISASLSGISSPVISLPVATAELSSIALSPLTPSNLAVGLTAQFTATGTYSDGSTADITAHVTWTSSDTNIATISVSGVATGIAAGNTNISASLSNVTSPVEVLPVAVLNSIKIAPAAPGDLTAGSTLLLKVGGTFSNGVNSLITAPVTWVSSNPDVVSVSSSGLITCKQPGSADITASIAGLTSAPLTIKVVAPSTTGS